MCVAYILVCVCISVCARVWRPEVYFGYLPSSLCTLLFAKWGTKSYWSWSLPNLARLASWPVSFRELRFFISPVLGLKMHTTSPGFYLGTGDPDRGTDNYTAGISLSDPSYQPQNSLIFTDNCFYKASLILIQS